MTAAEQLIEEYVAEQDFYRCSRYSSTDEYGTLESLDEMPAPKQPAQRALYRIQDLLDRFNGDLNKVDQHTALRARKATNVSKLEGILWAARELKLKRAEQAARQQLALLR